MSPRVWGVLAVGLVALGIAGVASRTALVSDDTMAPSLLPGDLVFLWPGTPNEGDVVAVVDPLDTSRWTLRRVQGIGGSIRYDAGSYVREHQAPLLDMGLDEEGFQVIQEGEHLTRHLTRNVEWDLAEVGVPDDSAWLGADNRDLALDSRWWGPVPLADLQGVVVLRFGAPRNRWRGWVEGRP